MGLIRWLQRKGSTGSIARWAYKGYSTLKAQDSSLSEAEIGQALFSMRYEMMPPRGNELRRYQMLVARQTDLSELRKLCMAVAEIEFGISVVHDDALWCATLDVSKTNSDGLAIAAPNSDGRHS